MAPPSSIRPLSKYLYTIASRKWRTPWASSRIVAVVTGASKGIGAGIAKALAAEGASVVVNYSSSKDGADRVVKEITSTGGKAIAIQGDVSKQADITRLFAETKKTFGKLNILVNNAGVYEFAPLEAISEELFHKQFNLNVLGLLLTTKEAVKLIGPEGGSIINIGSGASTTLPPNTATYSATKASVDAITVVLSKELGPRKIRVNSINPGMIETEGIHSAGYRGKRFPQMDRVAVPSRPHRSDRRYFPDRRLPGLVRLQISDR